MVNERRRVRCEEDLKISKARKLLSKHNLSVLFTWCVCAPQDAMQQWYQQYQAAQAHTYSTAAPQDSTATEYNKEHTQVTHKL